VKILGQLHLVLFSHLRLEKGFFFEGSTYEIALKTIIASYCVRENDLHATTAQSGKNRA
jgi:hypothetical protein